MSRLYDRTEKIRKDSSNGVETKRDPAVMETGDGNKAGWASPSYTHSKLAQVNPELMAANRCVGYFPHLIETEGYRVLRTQILLRTQSTGDNTLMVTSTFPNEGKTLTAINLAFTLARDFDHTVLLVDCDLRQQNIFRILGIPGEKGLVDYFLDNTPIEDLIVWPGVEKLTLISGGKTIEGSSEVLGAPTMKTLVAELKSRYPERFVIFDVPPVLSTTDALVFAQWVDHIVVVVEAGQTPVPDLKRALEMLPKEKVLGTVLNRHSALQDSYYYQKKYPPK
jgi:protein-tyrosine kinase